MKRLLKLFFSLLLRAWDVLVAGAHRLVGRSLPASCVVIYYHAINSAERARFAWQMDEVLRLTKPVPAGLSNVPESSGRFCAITFDDGFISVLENALPELERRNIPATLFVPTGYLGGPPSWTKPGSPARQQRVLSAQQLAALSNHSLLTIGSHSISHPDFLKLDPAQARVELEQSKAQLESMVGYKIGLFSFPHGRYNARLVEIARTAGYDRVFSINPSNAFSGVDHFVQGRVLVNPADWPLEFRLKILGAYRWLSKPCPSNAGLSLPPLSGREVSNAPVN